MADKSKKILVVDDAQTMRAIITKQLSSSFKVIQASSGIEALKLIKRHDFVLVTLDVEMANMDGIETISRIRKNNTCTKNSITPLPVVMISADKSLDTRRKCFASGANAFVNKPFKDNSLNRVVTGTLSTVEILSSSTILVVNSGRTARAIIKVFLESVGATVIEAEDGISALSLLTDKGQRIDMVLTEQDLSSLSGIELAVAIRQNSEMEHLPIIISSEPSDEFTVADIYNLGASDFLAAPFSKDELIARTRGQLESSNWKKELFQRNLSDHKKSANREILIGGFIHDLKSPLTVLNGYVNLILKKDISEESCQKYIPKMELQLNTMKDLAKDMVESIRTTVDRDGDTSIFADINVNDVIRNAIESLEYLAEEKGVTIRFESSIEDTENVFGDPRKIFRVFCNLLSNAIKFTDSGGEILFNSLSISQNIHITITDTGVGIPADSISNLFDSFTDSTRSGTQDEAGTGLGLSIVKSIIQEHAGRIEVNSTEGEGTVFTVKIPKLQKNKEEMAS